MKFKLQLLQVNVYIFKGVHVEIVVSGACAYKVYFYNCLAFLLRVVIIRTVLYKILFYLSKRFFWTKKNRVNFVLHSVNLEVLENHMEI